MEPNIADWKRMKFKGNKVWLATGEDGNAIARDGKVLIKYRKDHGDDYQYWVRKEKVKSLDAPDDPKPEGARKFKSKTAGDANEPIPPNAICVFTDGATSGNPGPSGIGVLLRYGDHEKEISKYIGMATNNIAELKAIEVGLAELKRTDLPVRVFTDSGYAYGLLALGWRAKKNTELVASILKIMTDFKNLKFIKVKGHSGHKENERVDRLAVSAIKNRSHT